MPLSRRESLRKKLRAKGQLSEFWKSQNLDMIQFTESCTADQSANEPLLNYLDVRPPGMGLGRAGSWEEGSASSSQCCISQVGGPCLGFFPWILINESPGPCGLCKQAPVCPTRSALWEERDEDG